MIKRSCRLTQKGQVTIPREIRVALGLKPGDPVQFRYEDNVATIAPATEDTPISKPGRPTATDRSRRQGALMAIRFQHRRLEIPPGDLIF